MGWDFKLDQQTNDLDLVQKDVAFTNSVDTVTRQRIAITLKTWLTEWFYNEAFGVPYRQSIIKKGITKAEVDSIFVSIINTFEDVIEITSYSSEYDKANRIYNCTFQVKIPVNNPALYSRAVPQDDTTIYPSPPDIPDNFCNHAEISIPQSSEFYELMNIDIPLYIPWT